MAKCKWCSKSFDTGGNGFFATKMIANAASSGYCSKKCEIEAAGGHAAIKEKKEQDTIISEHTKLERQRLALEKEKYDDIRRDKDAVIAKEKAQKRKEQSDYYHSIGKHKVAFFVGIDPNILLGIGLLLLVGSVAGFNKGWRFGQPKLVPILLGTSCSLIIIIATIIYFIDYFKKPK